MQAVSSNRLWMLWLLCLQGGCALHYVGSDGLDRDVGFLAVKSSRSKCTIDTTIESVGLTVDLTGQSGGLNIGYRSVTMAQIKPETVVEFQDGDKDNLMVDRYHDEASGAVRNVESRPCP